MRFRVYYNRRQDEPWVWSFDEGTQATERLLTGFRLHGVDVRDGLDDGVANGDEKSPRVWVEFEADTVRVGGDGVGRFYGRWTDSGWPVREG